MVEHADVRGSGIVNNRRKEVHTFEHFFFMVVRPGCFIKVYDLSALEVLLSTLSALNGGW